MLCQFASNLNAERAEHAEKKIRISAPFAISAFKSFCAFKSFSLA